MGSVQQGFPIGHSVTQTFPVPAESLDRFADLSGDVNPLHMDSAYARSAGFADRVAHGVLTLSFLSTVIGTKLPGDGALWRSLRVDWIQPVFAGDTVTITAEVEAVSEQHRSLSLVVSARNEANVTVMRGVAEVGLLETGSEEGTTGHDAPAAASAAESGESAEPANEPRAVLVLGGSGGIGSAIAEQLAVDGFAVMVGYHSNADRAEEVCQRIEETNGRAVPLQIDVAHQSPDDLSRALNGLPNHFQRCCGLVLAGSAPLVFHHPDEASFDDYEQMWRSNVRGAWLGYRALRERMVSEQWGRVVVLGTSAIIGTPPAQNAAYVSAKSALWGWVKAHALEAAKGGVTFNMISPNMVDTDYVRHVPKRAKMVEAAKNPRRRLGTPADSASLTRYLFSDSADFLNGCNLPLTGGGVMLG